MNVVEAFCIHRAALREFSQSMHLKTFITLKLALLSTRGADNGSFAEMSESFA